jgi:hypothetical protein
MLERVSSRRSIAIAFTLAAMAIDPELPVETEWRYGVIVPDSVWADRFTLRDSLDPPKQVEVVYRGVLPAGVCGGEDAVIEGNFDGDVFVATRVSGPGCTKGDPCRRWRCLPAKQRPAECRRELVYE